MLSLQKIGLIVNTASGSAGPSTQEELLAAFAKVGIPLAQVWSVDAAGLEAAIEEAKNLEVLVVFGGDGTIRTAAERSSMTGPVLLPLPGGTLNLLPKALYGDRSWQDILEAVLARPEIRTVSGAEAAGQKFFIAAILGAPALWASVRESLREGSLEAALEGGKEALDHLFDSSVSYEFNEMHAGEASAITVTCPLVSDALEDDRKALEAAVIDVQRAGDVLQLATLAAFGKWREDQNVAITFTKSVRVTSPKGVPVILDGEAVDAGTDVEIVFVPEAFRALVPGT